MILAARSTVTSATPIFSWTRAQLQRNIDMILHHFASQHGRSWFEDETFAAMARLRSVGCDALEGAAEAR